MSETVEYADPEYPDLTRREATRVLLGRIVASEGPERADLEERVIRLNMVVAGEVARRYRGRGIGADDLEQVAMLGLVKAVRGFRFGEGEDFLSYAVPTIRGELKRHFRDHGWAVRPPRSIQELQTRIARVEGRLAQQLGRSPRPSEIAEHLDVEVSRVIDALSADGCFAPTSLDADPADSADAGLGERLGLVDEAFTAAEARLVLQPLFAELDARDRTILEMRFVRGCTQAEIGAEIGVTQMQVSRLLTRILRRLRERLASDLAA